jgi:hypothetical protein
MLNLCSIRCGLVEPARGPPCSSASPMTVEEFTEPTRLQPQILLPQFGDVPLVIIADELNLLRPSVNDFGLGRISHLNDITHLGGA